MMTPTDLSGGFELSRRIGPFELNRVTEGDCRQLVPRLPDESVDIVITSPPYWGQRTSNGVGTEDDPRNYLKFLKAVFTAILPKLKLEGIVWINLGDAYNTPVNWRVEDQEYSSLGPDKKGLAENNSAYIKPRAKRKAFIDRSIGWLQYGNLLALPYRLIVDLCDSGYLFRGEVIWRKKNALPEGKCRRPHRHHESIYLLAKSERHNFQPIPPIKSVWEFPNEKVDGPPHYSRFPEELPRRCIEAYGKHVPDVVVLDPFSGSGTTGIAAKKLHCSYLGFEIDSHQVAASNKRLEELELEYMSLSKHAGIHATLK
jgi:DNA modification methylase